MLKLFCWLYYTLLFQSSMKVPNMVLNIRRFFAPASKRMPLLVLQNNDEYEEHIKSILGDLMGLCNSSTYLDLRDTLLMNFNDPVFERSKRVLGHHRQRIGRARVRKRSSARSTLIIRISFKLNVVTTFITKYIYNNGGLINHVN